MLPLGYVTEIGDEHHFPTHQSNLTNHEAITMMTLWSIARSPLFFGGDMLHLSNDPFTLSLLTNAGVLEVNSNSFNNRELSKNVELGLRYWGAEGGDGDGVLYGAVFNTGETDIIVDATSEFELPEGVEFFETLDLWMNVNLPPADIQQLLVSSHGSRLLKFTPK